MRRKAFWNLKDFVPSLREQIKRERFNLDNLLMLGVPMGKTKPQPPFEPPAFDRKILWITARDKMCSWQADSLRALFRGDRQPPHLGDYPEAYSEAFMILDMHALEFSRLFGDRRDAEMLEIYSNLRRRPDGRSLGPAHNYMWQAAALMLGMCPLSQAEYEAILSRLERSCRTFKIGPTSRNYIATLRQTLGQE